MGWLSSAALTGGKCKVNWKRRTGPSQSGGGGLGGSPELN